MQQHCPPEKTIRQSLFAIRHLLPSRPADLPTSQFADKFGSVTPRPPISFPPHPNHSASPKIALYFQRHFTATKRGGDDVGIECEQTFGQKGCDGKDCGSRTSANSYRVPSNSR
jgi:hypothetical protein